MLDIHDDAAALAAAAADRFAALAREAVEARGRFMVALAGGTTPAAMYERLAAHHRDDVPWRAVHLFWGDERHVPPAHSESNYRAADESLIARAPILPEHVHRIRAECPVAEDAAADYERVLRREFDVAPGGVPEHDLVLLGMGNDGHTASLFPGNAALREGARLVVAPYVEKFNAARITMTLPVLNRGRVVMFLVSGASKADTLKAVLEGPSRPDELPAQAIQPIHGQLIWMVDRDAARQLGTA